MAGFVSDQHYEWTQVWDGEFAGTVVHKKMPDRTALMITQGAQTFLKATGAGITAGVIDLALKAGQEFNVYFHGHSADFLNWNIAFGKFFGVLGQAKDHAALLGYEAGVVALPVLAAGALAGNKIETVSKLKMGYVGQMAVTNCNGNDYLRLTIERYASRYKREIYNLEDGISSLLRMADGEDRKLRVKIRGSGSGSVEFTTSDIRLWMGMLNQDGFRAIDRLQAERNSALEVAAAQKDENPFGHLFASARRLMRREEIPHGRSVLYENGVDRMMAFISLRDPSQNLQELRELVQRSEGIGKFTFSIGKPRFAFA